MVKGNGRRKAFVSPGRPTSRTEEEEREIINLYRDPSVPIAEIKNTYDVTNGGLYSLLKRHGVPTRQALDTQFPIVGEIEVNGNEQVVEGDPDQGVKTEEWTIVPPTEPIGFIDSYGQARPFGITEPTVQKELVVTTDSQDTVQTVQKRTIKPSTGTEWTIRFTGEVVIDAESIFQALNAVVKYPYVKRIYMIKLRSQ